MFGCKRKPGKVRGRKKPSSTKLKSVTTQKERDKIGAEGELSVNKVIRSIAPKVSKQYGNVILKTHYGSTEVDHILVTDRGVFIIETKAHKGTILGTVRNDKWVQRLTTSKGVKDYEFYNPIKQNEGHIKKVKELLGTDQVCGIVCFPNADAKSCKVPKGVVTLEGLNKTMVQIYKNSPPARYNIREVCGKIEKANQTSASAKRKHVAYVKRVKKNNY